MSVIEWSGPESLTSMVSLMHAPVSRRFPGMAGEIQLDIHESSNMRFTLRGAQNDIFFRVGSMMELQERLGVVKRQYGGPSVLHRISLGQMGAPLVAELKNAIIDELMLLPGCRSALHGMTLPSMLLSAPYDMGHYDAKIIKFRALDAHGKPTDFIHRLFDTHSTMPLEEWRKQTR